ncbi:glycosyltransferase family 39 protein [Haloarcula sp. Atlit-120R]|uniref:ArnT family glycosyltransferase n=1 Tax=Haloarcula sp. Atlit-120R TaxID=2282135 RepID=UPI000EF264EC|nr:hypothetical protein [Haloarcula sp. Atlit-120R]RLM32678.1 hypothetical protein DVK01_20620 [Haloarcula sp. Atlit-120R]
MFDQHPAKSFKTESISQPCLLFLLILAMLNVYTYLQGQHFPAVRAGLYLQGAEAIAENGFGLPVRIPNYATSTGIPFAYPPLGMYIVAVLHMLFPVSYIDLALYWPTVIYVIGVALFYFLAREFADPVPAVFAGVLFATAAGPIKYLMTAGGIVRGVGICFFIASAIIGYRYYTAPSRRRLFITAILVALTGLSHPAWAKIAIVTHIVFALTGSGSMRARIRRLLTVGAVSFTLVLPWLAAVIGMHGLGPFSEALARRSTGNSLNLGTVPVTLFGLVVIGGAGVQLNNREYTLPLWLFATWKMEMAQYILFAIGIWTLLPAILRATFRTLQDTPMPDVNQQVSLVMTGILILTLVHSAAGIGMKNAETGELVDEGDRTAFQWIRDNTESDATFAAGSYASEWLPYMTDRAGVALPFGYEWINGEGVDRRIRLHKQMRTCDTAQCLERTITSLPTHPDYLYLDDASGSLRSDLSNHTWFELRYNREGVLIYQVEYNQTTSAT